MGATAGSAGRIGRCVAAAANRDRRARCLAPGARRGAGAFAETDETRDARIQHPGRGYLLDPRGAVLRRQTTGPGHQPGEFVAVAGRGYDTRSESSPCVPLWCDVFERAAAAGSRTIRPRRAIVGAGSPG